MNEQSVSKFAEEQVFCPEQLMERCLGKIEFAQRILDVFLSHVHQDMDQLLDAVRAGDQHQLVQTAHRIKGSAASISARRMQSLMAKIEEAGRQKEIPEVESLQRLIHTESETLERVLTCWRSEDGAAEAKAGNESSRHFPLRRGAF